MRIPQPRPRRTGLAPDRPNSVALADFRRFTTWSGWPDLNRRPLRPELSAKSGKSAGRRRFGTPEAFVRDTLAVFDRI